MKRWGVVSVACTVASGMCLFALADLQIGYYTLLRLVVCIVAAWVGVRLVGGGRGRWSMLAFGVALLYNPVLPVRFEREVWAVLNFATAAALLVGAWVCRERVIDAPEEPEQPLPPPGQAVIHDQYEDLQREAVARLRARVEAMAAAERTEKAAAEKTAAEAERVIQESVAVAERAVASRIAEEKARAQ